MAQRKSAANPKIEEKVEENTPLSEVNINDIPGLGDNAAQENGGEAPKEEETTTPPADETTDPDALAQLEHNEKEASRRKDFDTLPQVEDDFLDNILHRIMKMVHEVEDAEEIILANTPSEDGVKSIAHGSDNKEVVAKRDVYNEIQGKVEKLEAELKALREESEEAWKGLYATAEEIQKKDLDPMLATGAKSAKDTLNKKITKYVETLQTEVDVSGESDEEREVRAFLTNVNSRRYAGIRMRVTSTSGDRPPSSRERSEKIRTWAAIPGNWDKEVKAKGRLAGDLVDAYEKATGDVG